MAEEHGGGKLLTSCRPGSRESKRKGLGRRYSDTHSTDKPSMTYFPQLIAQSSNQWINPID
jgi:hypothetical protein